MVVLAERLLTVKFVISHWSVLIRLLLVILSWSVKSPFVGFVSVVSKSFVRRL